MLNGSRESYIRYLRSITNEDEALYRYLVPGVSGLRMFYGKILEQSFRIIPQIPGRNLFTPIIFGRFADASPERVALKIKNAPFVIIWIVSMIVFSLDVLSALLFTHTADPVMIVWYGALLAVTAGLYGLNRQYKNKILKQYLPLLEQIESQADDRSEAHVLLPEETTGTSWSTLLPLGVIVLKVLFTILFLANDTQLISLSFASSTFIAALFAFATITTGTGEACFLLGLVVIAVFQVWEGMLIGFLALTIRKPFASSSWYSAFFLFFAAVMLVETLICGAVLCGFLYHDYGLVTEAAINLVFSLAAAGYAFWVLLKHRAK